MQTEKKPISLNKKILLFMILCWLIPLVIFFTFMTVSYQQIIVKKAERLMEDELKNIVSFASIRIGDAITLCQRPSYEKTWENSWKKWEDGEISVNEYLHEVNGSLKGKFYLDDRFNMYAYYRYGEDKPECFSSRTGISYKSYIWEIENSLEDIFTQDSSYAYVRVVDGRVFIVRNLYTTSDYERYGTLVVELNRDKIFKDVPESLKDNMVVCIGDTGDVINFAKIDEKNARQGLLVNMLEKYDMNSNRTVNKMENETYKGYLYQEKMDNYHMGIILFAPKSELYSSLYLFYAIVAAILALFLPLLWYGVHFLRQHIQIPVDRMMQAYRRMEEGEIGAVVGGETMPNLEFQYMMERFDSMSAQVKYLFDCVYDEKLARKDAQIQALQAQINPHFLNNTLEMMNWQARMSGDVVVSKMIESLGTVLDYRMNRANVKAIQLVEELQCVDAYFYIMSMRFGQRLSIEREIDKDLLYVKVPPLILQPIVENAVVHGVETVKNGAIRLKVFHDADNIYLEVRNTGKAMTPEELDRIQAILDGDESKLPETTGRHTSIGIRNVNRRIGLVYGEEYGLTITQNPELETISTITIPYNTGEEEKSLKDRTVVETELKNMARFNK